MSPLAIAFNAWSGPLETAIQVVKLSYQRRAELNLTVAMRYRSESSYAPPAYIDSSASNCTIPDFSGIRRGDGRRLEPLDDEVDPERQLPQELRDRGDGCRQGDLLEDPEQHGDKRHDEQGTADEPQHGHAAGHEAGAINKVAEQDPIAEGGQEAGTQQKRPVMDRDQGTPYGNERSSIDAGNPREVLA